MTRFKMVLGTGLVTAFVVGSIVASEDAPIGAPEVLFVDQHRDLAVEVPDWDPGSPQRLVRIEGRLYQKDRGRFFPVVPDRITVRLADGLGSWEDLLDRAAAVKPELYDLLARLQPRAENRLAIVDLAVPPGTDLPSWCELVYATGLARYAEVATYGVYLATRNDPRYPEQWGLHNTGQTGGTPGADIDAERAWDLTAGDPAIVVAVLDSGTDIDHEDLAANVWHNTGEIPDNGIDDDGNGYIDDWEGWNFDNDTNDPRATYFHGTHVTGIVNAVGSNGVGIAGIAGGAGAPGVQGMALGVGMNAPNSAVVDDAILYAADNGADVITISLSIGETQAINDALAYAYDTKDVFIDCASGNSGSSVAYPATRPEAMAVASTDPNDNRSGFSNPGPEVEVAAPGSNILSTQLGNAYGSSDGTSFAAPQVAGLAALIRSRNPGLIAADVRQLIIDTAEDVEDPGFDDKTGYGRINAYLAVSGAADSDGTIRLDAVAYSCDDAVGLTVSDIDLAGAGTLSITVRSDTESGAESVTLTEAGAGSGVFRGTIATSAGAAAPDGVLQVSHADTIVAEYVDADDGLGGTGILNTATAVVDCVAPAIALVDTTSLSNTSATVTWTTDEASTSLVRYGETPPPGQEVSVVGLSTEHSVRLSGLSECTTYRYEVESSDTVANTTTDDNSGADYTFETYGEFPGAGIVPCHQGQVRLDRDGTYACDDTVGITVIDSDLDTDPNVVETVHVLLTSTSEPAGEWVALTEITPQNSRFEGSFPIGSGPAVGGDGLLSVAADDLITATYHDHDDGQGGARTATDTSVAECTPPSILDVRVTEISATRAVVEWTTDKPASSRVDFGPTDALGGVVQDATLVTAHRVPISPFDSCDRAHFRVRSADLHGNVRIADAGGEPLTLNLSRIGGLVYHETFETDTGWQLPGDWERGSPQGLGSPSGDPNGAWSGAWSIGNDLSGQGTNPGDYEPSSDSSAVSPAFSTRQARDLELIIHRKLGVTSADEAGIYIITSGTAQVWTSNYQANDGDWMEWQYDIGALADNKSSVQIAFHLESSDPDHSYGWNVDEIIVKDRTQPDYLVCGGCGGAPTFRGVIAVRDPDPCGPGGLVMTWEPAPAWGTGTTGTYDVHRGTTPAFVPDASNRVATGLTATTWTDAAAPADTPVWYVVRARNDESCTGGEGLADGNLVRLQGIESTSQSLPSQVGATLEGGRVGGAHVRLEWAPAAGADHYVVRRGQSYDFSEAVEIGTTTGTLYEDAGAAADTTTYVYRVFAVDACGREE